MLFRRIFSATVILAVLLVLIWLDFHNVFFGVAGLWLIPAGLFCVIAGSSEMLALYHAKSLRPVAWSVYVGTTGIFLAACVPILWELFGKGYPADCPIGKLGWPLMALLIGMALALIGEMLRYKEPGGIVVNVALAIFSMVYVGLMMSFLVQLRLLFENDWGMAALLSVIVVAKCSDIGAYVIGRLMGKHKLTPNLSPGKTIEGAIGGIVAACLVSWIFFELLTPQLVGIKRSAAAWWGSLIFGLLIAFAGMLGDLAESLIKRDMGRKDSSNWMPGLGGVLDVLDSLLAAAPVAYMCWVIGLVGPNAMPLMQSEG